MSVELELIPGQPTVIPVEVANFIKGDTGDVTPEAEQAKDDAEAAALAAAQSAVEAENKVNVFAAELSGDGGSLVGVVQPAGPPMTLGEYLLGNKLICLSGDTLQSFIDLASALGGREVTLVPNMVYYTGLSQIFQKPGVTLRGNAGNAMSVQHVATGNIRGVATLKCGAISTDYVVIKSTCFNSTVDSVIIDCSLQVSGVGLLCDDSDGVQRVGTKIRNTLVYKRGLGAAFHVRAGHKEGSAHEIFTRCGTGAASAGDGEYGLICESVDWDFTRVLCGFAKLRSFLYTGGACRFRDVDAWGSQDISAEIQGSSVTIDRLQTDGSGNSGVLINGGDDVVIDKLICINNCLTASTPTDDIIIRGECRSMSISQLRLRGSQLPNPAVPGTFIPNPNIGYGIGFEDAATGILNIGDYNCASAYIGALNDNARAYSSVSGATNALSPARGASMHREQLTVNPLFTKWTDPTVPDGFSRRGSATVEQITPAGMSTGDYVSGARVTSGAVGVSGIQVILDKDKYKGRRIHVEGWFKGSGLTFLGNQRIQLFDGVNTFIKVIPNDNQWHWVSIDHQMSINATDVQIRLVAANDTTIALPLEMTAVYYWAY